MLCLADLGVLLVQSHKIAHADQTSCGVCRSRTSLKTVANQLGRDGRLAWQGLMLRVPLPRALFEGPSELAVEASQMEFEPSLPRNAVSTGGLAEADRDDTWCMAMPDVFSIRAASVTVLPEHDRRADGEPAKPRSTSNSPPDPGRLCVVRVDFGVQRFLQGCSSMHIRV